MDLQNDTRPPLAEQGRAMLRDAFAALPAHKRGALVLIGDEQGMRVATAARLGDSWKVAGEVKFVPGVRGTVGYQVVVMGAW